MKTQTFEEWLKWRILINLNKEQLTELLREAYNTGYEAGHYDCANTISEVLKKLKYTGIKND